jgi:hypothetical protein
MDGNILQRDCGRPYIEGMFFFEVALVGGLISEVLSPFVIALEDRRMRPPAESLSETAIFPSPLLE